METQRRTQADRTAATRAALMAAARRLFADPGFAAVGTEAIVREAAVSRGALYHHFADKTELFAAVLEEVEGDIAGRLAEVAAGVDGGFAPKLISAVETWLDECEQPEIQRIVLVDGPSVLGWVRWREICQRHVLGLIRAVLDQGIAAGELRGQPVTPLAHALIAVADEAALYVVSAAEPAKARREMIAVAKNLLAALEVKAG